MSYNGPPESQILQRKDHDGVENRSDNIAQPQIEEKNVEMAIGEPAVRKPDQAKTEVLIPA